VLVDIIIELEDFIPEDGFFPNFKDDTFENKFF